MNGMCGYQPVNSYFDLFMDEHAQWKKEERNRLPWRLIEWERRWMDGIGDRDERWGLFIRLSAIGASAAPLRTVLVRTRPCATEMSTVTSFLINVLS